MSLYLTELDIEHERVFCDTGWEADVTYKYLRGELTDTIGPIAEVSATETLDQMAIRKGIFPTRLRRWCTERLKLLPLQAYFREYEIRQEDVVSAVGIRHGESKKRAQMPEWEWTDGFDCEIWRPMISWTEQDVIDIHTRHGLRPNPLYLRGAKRVGCWPCIYARKSEVRLIAEEDPARIERIRQAEAAASETARRIIEARGEVMDIDEVVAWSRTSRGGRQFELFEPSENERGCMRWGLCETHGADE